MELFVTVIFLLQVVNFVIQAFVIASGNGYGINVVAIISSAVFGFWAGSLIF